MYYVNYAKKPPPLKSLHIIYEYHIKWVIFEGLCFI